MKTLITISALALMSNLAFAENFTYEQQIASSDLSNQDFPSSEVQASSRDVRLSLDDAYRGNPDVENVPFEHEGMIVHDAMRFSSYDQLSRQNPDLGGV